MTLPAIGYLSRCGVGVETTWGVAVPVTQLHAYLSETVDDPFTQLHDLSLQGRASGRQSDQGVQNAKGDIVIRARYILGDLILQQFFGSLAAGTYTALKTVYNKSLTIVLGKGPATTDDPDLQSIWELAGVKITKLVWTASPTEQVKLTATIICKTIKRSGIDTTVNTPTILRGLLNTAPNMLFTDLVLRLGDHNQVLDPSNELGVDTFTLTLERPMDELHTNQSRQIIQQLENAMRVHTIAWKLPRYLTDQYTTWRNAQTRLQASLVFTGGTGGSKTIRLPQAILPSVKSPVGGPGPIPIDKALELRESEDQLISTALFATAADNSLNTDATTAVQATGTLTMTGVAKDGETVTVGRDVYEVDTSPGLPTVVTGRIPIALAGGSTRQAQGTLTIAVQPTAGDRFTIGTKTYTYDANGSLVNIDGHIEIGTTLTTTQTNTRNAVNRTGTPGTGYAQATVKHPSVTMGAFSVNAAVVTAIEGGTAGNTIATTSVFTSPSNLFNAATLGTTQAGVDPTAAEFVTAFIAAVVSAGTAGVFAAQGAGTTVTLTAVQAGTLGNNIVTTRTLANGSFGAATLTGGTGTPDTIPFTVAGADVWVHGFVGAANTGRAKVVSWTARKLILDTGMTLVDEAAGPSVTLQIRSYDFSISEA